MFVEHLMTPEEQIADARWYLAEVSNDVPPGCTNRLVEKTRAWVRDLETLHARGELAPIVVFVDPDVPF